MTRVALRATQAASFGAVAETYERARPSYPDEAVLVAQAWHWVDVERGVREVARVLKPGGRLGLVWNIRDEREDRVTQLGRIMHQSSEQNMGSTNPQVGPPFGPIERLDVD
jgi:SAM-dependent methyltransferase